MTRTLIGIAAVMAVAACGKSDSKDGGGAAAATDLPADHVAAVNALIPADAKDKLEFEAASVDEGTKNSPRVWKVARPKDWKESNVIPGSFSPADSDGFGSKTLGRSKFKIGSNCDGDCVAKDWAATSDKVDFAQFTNGSIPGKVVRDEKTATGRTLVFERALPESFPENEVAVYLVRAWWSDGAKRYQTCRADLGVPLRGALAAFEKACSQVVGG